MLHIVLIEPRIPQNVGNIARTVAATGTVLHLVEPMGFVIEDKKLKRAGLDYWHLLDIRQYPDTKTFFETNNGPYFFFSTKANRLYTEATFPDEAFLVFGREDQGLPETLLTGDMGAVLRLPMIKEARSLNLSNAVAVALYEALRQRSFAG